MGDLITVVAEFKAKPGREAELRAALLALVEPTRKEDGCVQYDLHMHATDPGRFVFYENWASDETLTRHAASEHLKALGEKLGDLALERRVEKFVRIA